LRDSQDQGFPEKSLELKGRFKEKHCNLPASDIEMVKKTEEKR